MGRGVIWLASPANLYGFIAFSEDVRNLEVARVLYEIADLLEMKGEDRFRPIAYRRAAREIEAIPEDLEDLWREGGLPRLRRISGIGEAIAEKIDQYLREGKVDALEELKKEFPPGLVRVMSIPGVGPKTASVLWRKLGITGLEDLRRAAEQGQLRRLKGFGEKSEEKILRGIKLVSEQGNRTLLANAWEIAEEVIAYLKDHAPIEKISPAGSLRRMREDVGDIDILAVSSEPSRVREAFTKMPIVEQVVLAGETKATVIRRGGVQIDLRIVEPASWGAALQYFTGNKDHNIHLRSMAQNRGWKLNEYGLFESDRPIAGETEEGIYSALGLRWMPPELREETGEIDAAFRGELPRLVELKDIRGDFHVHTEESDGVETLETIVQIAVQKGYEYIGISDHSPSLTIANGLDADRLRMHLAHIRRANREMEGKLTVLAGTECDILENGALDYPDEILAQLDYVIVSVHSKFNLPEKEQTDRVLKAIENPHVNIYAHPTTRLLGQREPIAIDLEAVMEVAAESGTALEINAYPNRMDLNGAAARLAKEKGCKIAVDTDTHTRGHLDYMRFGVGMARRAWLGPEDIVNCWLLDRAREFFE